MSARWRPIRHDCPGRAFLRHGPPPCTPTALPRALHPPPPSRQPEPRALVSAQVTRAVAEVLAHSPIPLPLPAIEARFKGRGPWKKGLPTLLQTLEALGRAQVIPTESGPAWRGLGA